MSVGWRKWTGREAASGCRGTRAQRQGAVGDCGAAILPLEVRVDPSLRCQRRLHILAASPPLRWPLLPPCSGRTRTFQSFSSLVFFSGRLYGGLR